MKKERSLVSPPQAGPKGKEKPLSGKPGKSSGKDEKAEENLNEALNDGKSADAKPAPPSNYSDPELSDDDKNERSKNYSGTGTPDESSSAPRESSDKDIENYMSK